MLTHMSSSSYKERSLNAYDESLAARSWSDVGARSVDWDEDLVARGHYYARSYDDSGLYARTSYDAFVDARIQRREDARVLARELVNLLYARNSKCHAVLRFKHLLTVEQTCTRFRSSNRSLVSIHWVSGARHSLTQTRR